MTLLERWLPFRFRRRSADERKTERQATRLQTRATPAPEPWWPMPPMRQWMRTMVDDPWFSEPLGAGGDLERWFGDYSPGQFLPRVDVTDEDTTLKVTAELPGMSGDDLDLSIENGRLSIRGEKRHAEEGTERGVYRSERYYGYVHRSVPLPADVDQERAEAAFDKGVLTVCFPKRAAREMASTRIPITDRT